MSVLAAQTRRGRSRMASCEQPGAGRRPDAQGEATLFDDLGGEPTLDELVSGAWEGLVAHRPVPCPVCGGQLAAVDDANGRAAEGRCGDCGTTLS